MTPDKVFFCVLMGSILIALVAALLLDTRPSLTNAEAQHLWRAAAGKEQHLADQWRTLFERQRNIEDLSPAAQRHEQFDIDRHARVLGYDVRETRRNQS